MNGLNTKSVAIPPRTVIGVICVALFALSVILTMPAFVGVLGIHYKVSDSALGRLAAAEFVGYISGTYSTNARSIEVLARWVPWACAMAGIANVAGIFVVTHVPLILFHPLAAFGAGISYGYMLKVVNASGEQQRNFGMFLALVNLTELGGFQLIAFMTENYRASSVFVIYAISAFGALIIASITRRSLTNAMTLSKASGAEKEGIARPRRPRLVILISIVAVGISYIAYGMIWPFVQLMGETRGFSQHSVANGLSAYAITAILGSLAAAALPARINLVVVFCIGLCVVLGSIYLLYIETAYIWFFTGCAVFGFYWPFSDTLQLGIVAKADASGRGIVLCGISPSIGIIIGSYVGGMLIQGTNYLPQARVAAAVCIVGIGGSIATIIRIRRFVPESGQVQNP